VSDPDSKQPPDPGGSGSVDVQLSSPHMAAADPDAAPEPVPTHDSAPVTSGRVLAVSAGDQTGPVGRTRRLRDTVQEAVSGGVEKLGTGIGTLGEGVSKLGDATKKVPLVGAGVAKIGEQLTRAGESIHVLPRVAQTRRGRLLVRSSVVGFLLVFSWIAVIVGLQLQGNDTPDFRPVAERILVDISKGSAGIDRVYEESSPRFQEMVSKERFSDDMTDMNATVGRFREITSINDTVMSTGGATGRTGRLSITASFDKGVCSGSISFHRDQGQWRFLGIGFELPANLVITEAQREQRVAACKDPDNRKTCDVREAAERILEQVDAGQAGAIWDSATPVFQKQETRAQFLQLQAERRAALGAYRRILSVTEAKLIGGTSATFDVLAEFEKSSAVRTVFGFERTGKAAPWQLRLMKVVLPMPREEDARPPPPAPSSGAPHDAGVRASDSP
jgi:hypothetical protein